MTARERLAEVFDRGLEHGEASLSPVDRELFRIQSFIVDDEMGGLSAYLSNRLPDLESLDATVAAMSAWGLPDLAALLGEAVALFHGYTDPDPPTTWEAVCAQYDPNGRLDELQDEIAELDDYGLDASAIV